MDSQFFKNIFFRPPKIDFPKNHVFLALIYEGRCQNWNFSLRFSKRLISHRSDLSQVKQSKF